MSVLLFLMAGVIFSQDLVNLAKKERERRAQLDTTSSRVVTHRSLLKLKAQPAIEIPPQIFEPEPTAPDSQEYAQIPGDEETVQPDERETKVKFGTEVLPSSEFVQNVEEAIGEPDGKSAVIGYWGWLDVALEVSNGEGNDIAVYASRSYEGVQDSSKMHYLVFVQDDSNWVCIGIGGGETGPEYFDLLDIPSADKVRIMYRNRYEIDQIHPNLGQIDRISSYRMWIDSVQALH